jgi:hypothetical protein
MYVSVAVEGYADEAVARSLCKHSQVEVTVVHNCRGKGALDRRLPGFNAAARYANWLVLRDLDHDASCAPSLRQSLLPDASSGMAFCIVIREVEAWLLGDAEQFATFFRVPRAILPGSPEMLGDAKGRLLSIIRRSRSRELQDDMLPRADSAGQEGPLYSAWLADFAERHWRPTTAAQSCVSLRRAIGRLAGLRRSHAQPPATRRRGGQE